MAQDASDYTRGEMTVDEHKRTYVGFMRLAKWGSLYIAGLILLITIWFCTTGGLLAAVISTAVLIGIGTLVLSEKHGA